MSRLNSRAVSRGVGVRCPGYNRGNTGVGIVHLGIGAFHRAHQALYTEQVLEQFGGDWAIAGVSLRSARVRDQLQAQDGWYTSVERHGNTVNYQLVGAVTEVLVAPENPGAVIERLADPAVSVVTLTITEKGYCLGGNGELDPAHPDIVHDLAAPALPLSAVGYLRAGLALRRGRGGSGLTIISCDNLSGNGRLLAAALQAFCGADDAGLAQWINNNCSFPDTMVDKIVPATTAADLADVAAVLGVEDAAVVVGEPFRQWIIADEFAGPVPHWDKAGALFVSDVAPYEALKLRLLNASHSAIAYLGCLAGWQTVAAAMAEPAMVRLVSDMMTLEIVPGLAIPPGFDVADYQASLLQRFANPALEHQTAQIAMDGSQKLPQRIVPSLARQLHSGGSIERLALALAAWVSFSRSAALAQRLDDPRSAELRDLYQRAGAEPEAYLAAVLAWTPLIPAELAGNEKLRETLLRHLRALQQGVPVALQALAASR